MPHAIFIPFLFALGSCVGSFLNVVVWRLPRIEHDENDRSIFGPLKTMNGLSYPPSHCPRCNTPLKWYDNLPVIGWIKLGGKCRFCKEPISMRYPIIEAITGLLFVFYYVMFFIVQVGPCAAQPVLVSDPLVGTLNMMPRALDMRLDWAIYLLYMALVSGLLASSLIDAELFIIPVEIPWVLGVVGIIVHTLVDKPTLPGALNANVGTAALGIGGAVGLLVSILLWSRGIIGHSFPEGEPMQDVGESGEIISDERRSVIAVALITCARALKPFLPVIPIAGGAYLILTQSAAVAAAGLIAIAIAVGFWMVGQYTLEEPVDEQTHEPTTPPVPWTRKMLMVEMRKEMMFLLPPMLLAAAWWFATSRVAPISSWWHGMVAMHWFSGLCGAVLGALVGAFVVWITRILGTIAFGRLAMGLGDVHLMFGVGAIVGAGGATIAFFLAPFFGILIAIYLLIAGTRREIPYGPYLSLATAAVLLFCCPILAYLTPGMMGLSMMIQSLFH